MLARRRAALALANMPPESLCQACLRVRKARETPGQALESSAQKT